MKQGAPLRAPEDTIVALATPPGRSALGIVRLSGAHCREIALQLLGTPPPTPLKASTRRVIHNGTVIDKVVALYWTAPNTPTGEDVLEIISHGSPTILREIIEACVQVGARPAAPGEFTRRSFVNGRMALSQAQAVNELISARNSSERSDALARLEGGLTQALAAARKPLVALLAQIEARLDHPDEDIAQFSHPEIESAFKDSLALIDGLISSYDRGQKRREGKRIGLFGPPNAGKSSLFNALLGRQRAITSPVPGTTRDYLEEEILLGGQPVCLIDTAGRHDAPRDDIEREGIRRSDEMILSCDVILHVLDARLAADEESVLRPHPNLRSVRELTVMNKVDLLKTRPEHRDDVFYCSALTGDGIDILLKAIADSQNQAASLITESVLTEVRGRECLRRASIALNEARGALMRSECVAPEIAAHFIRQALADIDQTEGCGVTESVLDAIFSQFCVGK